MGTLYCGWLKKYFGLFQVCEEQQCQEEVFALAMNYMDRFLNTIEIKKTQLQLLGTACLLISSKLRETITLKCNTLVACADRGFSLQDLKVSSIHHFNVSIKPMYSSLILCCFVTYCPVFFFFFFF